MICEIRVSVQSEMGMPGIVIDSSPRNNHLNGRILNLVADSPLAENFFKKPNFNGGGDLGDKDGGGKTAQQTPNN